MKKRVYKEHLQHQQDLNDTLRNRLYDDEQLRLSLESTVASQRQTIAEMQETLDALADRLVMAQWHASQAATA